MSATFEVAQPPALRTRCPICSATDLTDAWLVHGWRIVRCSICTAAFVGEAMTEEEVTSRYSTEYFEGGGFEAYPDYLKDESCHRRQARYYLGHLRRLGRTGGSLLDIGCAAGFFLDEARSAGWQTRGCDVSEYTANYARTRLNLSVDAGAVEDLIASDETFDVATLFSVIAHVAEPRRIEATLHRLLRSGGIVLLETSNRDATIARLLGRRWHLLAPPTVLHYFNRKSLETLFPPARWRLTMFKSSIKWISVAHVLSRMAGRSSNRALLSLGNSARLWTWHVPYLALDLALVAFQKR
jgi:2-polyprenyl-3-methyl-5-hydroxy-6-metoxy-1,4-benzoquinol methylase